MKNKITVNRAITEVFGNTLRKIREAHGMTRESLAEKANLSPQNIAKLESGDRFITSDSLFRLCGALKCDPSDLFLITRGKESNRPSMLKISRLLKGRSEQELQLAHDVLVQIFKSR